MSRGRPSKSEIREKITAILNQLKISYGYEIYKYYKEVFNDATARVIYYHLKKGTDNGEFINVDIKSVPGNFSWGEESERVYYALGPFSKTKKEWWDKTTNIDIKPRKIDYDWGNEIKNKIKELKKEIKNTKNDDYKKIKNKCDKLKRWCKQKINNPELEKEIDSIKLFIK
jgi:hypothetical protein